LRRLILTVAVAAAVAAAIGMLRGTSAPAPEPGASAPPSPSAGATAAAATSAGDLAPVQGTAAATQAQPVPVLGYRVVSTYPHDPAAFTQGLVYVDGTLYEGTGLNGESTLRRVDLETGEVLQQTALAADHFGEGIAVIDQRIFQLTWRTHTAFVYDRATFAAAGEFVYDTEGWGLTYDGEKLIMSDGTPTLFFRDPQTFGEVDRVTVRAQGVPVEDLNELEVVDDLVYANVWLTDRIAVVDPADGTVRAWLDLAGLLPAEDRTPATDVLNGIAYDAAAGRLFVTGKRWPKLFEIEVTGWPAPETFRNNLPFALQTAEARSSTRWRRANPPNPSMPKRPPRR
jgi:glutamine cyclotransferase